MAAARIYENREHYFPGVEPRSALAYDEFTPGRYVLVCLWSDTDGAAHDHSESAHEFEVS